MLLQITTCQAAWLRCSLRHCRAAITSQACDQARQSVQNYPKTIDQVHRWNQCVYIAPSIFKALQVYYLVVHCHFDAFQYLFAVIQEEGDGSTGADIIHEDLHRSYQA